MVNITDGKVNPSDTITFTGITSGAVDTLGNGINTLFKRCN
jgi:hypothetical protein